MKRMMLVCMLIICLNALFAQKPILTESQKQSISTLIDQYSKARETNDTMLLKSILATDIDQLVSTGEWRIGIDTAIKGMLNSTATNAGKRTLTIHNTKALTNSSAVVDCRYQIKDGNNKQRDMWSTFIVAQQNNVWKICAIRNMLPSSD